MNCDKLSIYSTDLMNLIIKIIGKHGKVVDGRLEYSGKAILIEDNYGTRFWLRVMYYNDKIKVDFSTVELKNALRRKGVFSEICEMVKEKDYIESAVISNVCTHEMYNFCVKNGFELNKMMNSYKIK